MPLFPIIVVVLALIGFFGHIGTVFMVGGVLAILIDLYGFLTGRLNPLFPIVLYVGGYIVFGAWYGILWGAVIGSAIEVILFTIMLLGGGTYFLFDKFKKNKTNPS